MRPLFDIQCWEYGWVIAKHPGTPGVPLGALPRCMKLFPENAFIDVGIAHHLIYAEGIDAVMCVVTEHNAILWREKIDESLKSFGAQERWWKGTNVGLSSAAIFAVLCDPQWKMAANNMGKASIPHDNSDFARCELLLDLIPEWKTRLNEVAEAYPDTEWPKIIANWDERSKDE